MSGAGARRWRSAGGRAAGPAGSRPKPASTRCSRPRRGRRGASAAWRRARPGRRQPCRAAPEGGRGAAAPPAPSCPSLCACPRPVVPRPPPARGRPAKDRPGSSVAAAAGPGRPRRSARSPAAGPCRRRRPARAGPHVAGPANLHPRRAFWLPLPSRRAADHAALRPPCGLGSPPARGAHRLPRPRRVPPRPRVGCQRPFARLLRLSGWPTRRGHAGSGAPRVAHARRAPLSARRRRERLPLVGATPPSPRPATHGHGNRHLPAARVAGARTQHTRPRARTSIRAAVPRTAPTRGPAAWSRRSPCSRARTRRRRPTSRGRRRHRGAQGTARRRGRENRVRRRSRGAAAGARRRAPARDGRTRRRAAGSVGSRSARACAASRPRCRAAGRAATRAREAVTPAAAGSSSVRRPSPRPSRCSSRTRPVD